MSKQLVARALAELSDSRVLIRSKIIDEPIAALIRAVDAQYPEGYDEAKGLDNTDGLGPVCSDCRGWQSVGHFSICTRWPARTALLDLCRDILGEKG